MSGYTPPVAYRPAPATINLATIPEGPGIELLLAGGAVTGLSAFPTANMSLWFPFTIPFPYLIRRFVWLNGTPVSGNVDVGVYNETFTRLISTGSTVQATVNDLQQVTVTDTWLTPGSYYLALACDNTTSSFYRAGLVAAGLATLGCLELASNFPLAAGPLSPVTIATSAYFPQFGITNQTVI